MTSHANLLRGCANLRKEIGDLYLYIGNLPTDVDGMKYLCLPRSRLIILYSCIYSDYLESTHHCSESGVCWD